MPKFNPLADIPDLAGKIYLVTGGSSGLGEACVAAIAQHNPAKVYLAARSRAKADQAIARIRATSPKAAAADIDFLDMDLASLDSVRAAAARVNREAERLDVLQLNGGIGMTPHEKSRDGYELQFATNYLGHALLTRLLMPKLLATAELPGADVRVVSMSSIGHRRAVPPCGIDFSSLKTDGKPIAGPQLYGQVMLAKVLLARELAKRYPTITSCSLHPGVVKTGVWEGDKDIPWLARTLIVRPFVAIAGLKIEEGVKGQLWCSFAKGVENGAYYEPLGTPGMASPYGRDDEMAEKLWKWTDKELEAHMPSA